ncbi:Neurexin-3b Neurexin IIIb-alpha, partial [Takifugu flavidus]
MASKQPPQCLRMTVSLSPQTTDDIVSSAECSSDDEDLEECDSGHAAKSSKAARPLRAAFTWTWQLMYTFTPIYVISFLTLRYVQSSIYPLLTKSSKLRGELVIPVLVEDPIDIPSVSTRSPFIPLPPTLRPVLTIIETTKESLAMATEAGVPCLSDRGNDDCDGGDDGDGDDDDDDDDGMVISGFGSGEAFDSSLPPTDDEDFYTTFSLVTDKILTTSAYEGGYKALAPKWEAKDLRPSKASEAAARWKMNNREVKPLQPDIVLLPLPTSFDLDGTKPRGPFITSPMLRTVPAPLPTVPSVVRRVPPGASEVIRESSSTTGMVVGIVSAAALCILILLYAMYK